MLTAVWLEPEAGVNTIFGTTLKIAPAKSPLEPVAVIVYQPPTAVDEIVTVPVSVPPETLQVEDDMRPEGPDVNVHDVSEPANPDPLTLIDCPGLPNAGFRVRVGGDPTLKRAEAELPSVGP